MEAAGNRQKKLRCLLLSPVAPNDPDNGDAQFTRDLLAYPPDGVEFVTYIDALKSGDLRWGPSVQDPAGWRHPLADPVAAGARAGIHLMRRLGALLPDPIRWLRVAGSFDIVHVHCIPVRFLGPCPPVVVSDSAGTFWYWTAGRGMEGKRVEQLLRRERRLARAAGYIHPSANPRRTADIETAAPSATIHPTLLKPASCRARPSSSDRGGRHGNDLLPSRCPWRRTPRRRGRRTASLRGEGLPGKGW